MKYVEYSNQDAAEKRSGDEMKKSAGYRSENITQFRWRVDVNEDTGAATIAVPDKDMVRLTSFEKTKAMDKTALENKDVGWFKRERSLRAAQKTAK